MNTELQRLIDGRIDWLLDGTEVLPPDAILLAGSFNPLHHGHTALLAAAERMCGRPGLLELSINNVDKPPLDAGEIMRRLRAIGPRHPVVLTRAPTFAEKAELFPGAWFALGFDTAVRLLSPVYHDDIPGMLGRFRALGTRFAVAGRVCGSRFCGIEALHIPAGSEPLFISIPEDEFREDISSTQLREAL